MNKKQFPHLRLKNMLNEIDKDSGDITLRVHDEDDDSKIELDKQKFLSIQEFVKEVTAETDPRKHLVATSGVKKTNEGFLAKSISLALSRQGICSKRSLLSSGDMKRHGVCSEKVEVDFDSCIFVMKKLNTTFHNIIYQKLTRSGIIIDFNNFERDQCQDA